MSIRFVSLGFCINIRQAVIRSRIIKLVAGAFLLLSISVTPSLLRAVGLREVYSFSARPVPKSTLVQGTDGLYGTTWVGGTAGNGTVFRVATNGLLTTLMSFSA